MCIIHLFDLNIFLIIPTTASYWRSYPCGAVSRWEVGNGKFTYKFYGSYKNVSQTSKGFLRRTILVKKSTGYSRGRRRVLLRDVTMGFFSSFNRLHQVFNNQFLIITFFRAIYPVSGQCRSDLDTCKNNSVTTLNGEIIIATVCTGPSLYVYTSNWRCS